MITPKIGQAMGQAAERHNDVRKQKLIVFYKALEIIETTSDWKSGESKVVFAGTLQAKQAEIFLLSIGDKITLNLTVEGKTFEALRMTEVVNEGDYLAWNLKIRKEMLPQKAQAKLQAQPAPRSRPNQISNPKAVSQRAKNHDVTPLDNNIFRVRSSSSGNEYFVRLLPDEDGGTCECDWGQYRRYADAYKSGCSHVQAVYIQLEGQRNRTTSAWSTIEDAKRQKRQIADIGDGVILTLRKLDSNLNFRSMEMTIKWSTNEDQSYIGTDENGNRYRRSANHETVSVVTPDGYKGCSWTARDALAAAMSDKEAACKSWTPLPRGA